MMKHISRMLSILLLAAMLLMMTGCSAAGDKEKLIGTWTAELDFAELVNEEIAADEEMAQYFVIDEMKLVLTMTFHEDDTYSMAIEEDSVEAAILAMKEDLREGMEAYLLALIEANEMDMTVDQVLAAMGTDMDTLMNEMFSEESIDAMMAEMGDMNQEGNFKAEDGKLHLSDGKDYAVDENEYEVYELTENTLTLSEGVYEEELGDTLEGMYPVVFTKVTE